MKRTAAVCEAPAAARAALAMRCGWVSDHSRGPNAEGSWSQCAAKKSWRLSRNRYPVAQTECLLFRKLPAYWLLERLPTASRRYGAARPSRNRRSAAVSAEPAAAGPNMSRRWSYGRSLRASVGDGAATGASPTVALRGGSEAEGLERGCVRRTSRSTVNGTRLACPPPVAQASEPAGWRNFPVP